MKSCLKRLSTLLIAKRIPATGFVSLAIVQQHVHRKRGFANSHIFAITGLLCIVGISISPAFGQGVARQIGKLLSSCTAQHGYSVKDSDSLGDYQLGTGELAWRRCVYDGIRAHIFPNTPFPDLYEDLIRNDDAMTVLIGKKELTRKNRRIWNLRAIMKIQEREDNHLVEREKLLREQAKTMEAAREVQNVLDMQRRVFEINRSALEGLR